MELMDKFISERGRFQSILNATSKLYRTGHTKVSTDAMMVYYEGPNIVVGIKVSNSETLAFVEQTDKTKDIETRAEFCSLLAKFYDEVHLNGRNKWV